MGAYTCIKPSTFAGIKYLPGDTIPAEAIAADRVGAVIRMGLIAEQAAGATAERSEQPMSVCTFTVPIIFDNGDVEQLPVTPATVEEAVSVLQMTAEGATKHIADMTDTAALILIDACDSRKTVKAAATARAKVIEKDTETSGQGTADAAQNGE